LKDSARWVLLLQRGSEDVLYEAAAMTAAAVSLGLEVTLVWFDQALAALAAGRLDAEEDEGLPGTFASAGRLLREARLAGGVRFLACSASALRDPGGMEAARRRVDDVVGWPTAIALIRAAEHAFVW
jgi:peroxiredoxin family protein